MTEQPQIIKLPNSTDPNEPIEYLAFPIIASKKGVRTIEIPKTRFQITKESSERWEFMEKLQ